MNIEAELCRVKFELETLGLYQASVTSALKKMGYEPDDSYSECVENILNTQSSKAIESRKNLNEQYVVLEQVLTAKRRADTLNRLSEHAESTTTTDTPAHLEDTLRDLKRKAYETQALVELRRS